MSLRSGDANIYPVFQLNLETGEQSEIVPGVDSQIAAAIEDMSYSSSAKLLLLDIDTGSLSDYGDSSPKHIIYSEKTKSFSTETFESENALFGNIMKAGFAADGKDLIGIPATYESSDAYLVYKSIGRGMKWRKLPLRRHQPKYPLDIAVGLDGKTVALAEDLHGIWIGAIQSNEIQMSKLCFESISSCRYLNWISDSEIIFVGTEDLQKGPFMVWRGNIKTNHVEALATDITQASCMIVSPDRTQAALLLKDSFIVRDMCVLSFENRTQVHVRKVPGVWQMLPLVWLPATFAVN